jgi:sterol O-acyltransferase
MFYVFAFLSWTLFREWPWTHAVFFVLHGLVMLMKQHSYAFYNGHLSTLYKTRKSLEQKLKRLRKTAPVQSPSATTPGASSLSTSYLDKKLIATEITRRRQSNHDISITDRARDLAQVAAATESGGPLDADQIQTFERIVRWEIDALSEDLKGKATRSDHYYPKNLTFSNHYEFIVLPTLVYELEYPRSDKINWYYVVEKAVATFGILFVMMLVSQTFIYPVVVKTMAMKESGMPLQERLEEFPWILSDLIFPFMMEYMVCLREIPVGHTCHEAQMLTILQMTWYILFESLLNFLAELTYFADRGFYVSLLALHSPIAL